MKLDAGFVLASLVISGAGFVAFTYGRKQRRLPQLIAGVVLMIFPYFVPNVLPMCLVGAGLLGLMWLAIWLGL